MKKFFPILLTIFIVSAFLLVAIPSPVLADTITPVPGDPLTGSGSVSRTLLTYNDLMTGSSAAPVDDSAFAVPANAAAPTNTFEGTLALSSTATGGGFTEIRDDYNYTGTPDCPASICPISVFNLSRMAAI